AHSHARNRGSLPHRRPSCLTPPTRTDRVRGLPLQVVAVILIGLVFVLALNAVGVYLIRAAFRAPVSEDGIAVARVQPQGARRAAGKIVRFFRAIGRSIQLVVGLALTIGPWWILYELFSTSNDGGHQSKGRVLRVRNRARLPRRAIGPGWSGDAVRLEHAL